MSSQVIENACNSFLQCVQVPNQSKTDNLFYYFISSTQSQEKASDPPLYYNSAHALIDECAHLQHELITDAGMDPGFLSGVSL